MDGPISQMERTFAPRVLLIGSPDAEALWRSSFCTSMAESFNTFSNFSKKVSIRGADGHPHDIHDFQVEFIDAQRLKPMDGSEKSKDEVNGRLKHIVSSFAPDYNQRYGPVPLRNRSDIHGFLRECAASKGRKNHLGEYPWFLNYRDDFLRSLGASEHEYVSHAIICIIVASSRESSPVDKCREMSGKGGGLPPAVSDLDKVIGGNLPLHYVLLHDARDTSKLSEKVFGEVMNAFGSNSSHILRVRCAEDGKNVSNLPQDDRTRIKNFVADIAYQRVIPTLEKEIRPLHDSVTAQRKRLTGIRSWFRFEKNPPQQSGGKGGESLSLGLITRRLADYCFLLRDYETALNYYKLSQADFKTEKQWKLYAGTCEMIGVSMLLIDPANKIKETETELDKAYCYYMRSPKACPFAARVTFLLCSILLSTRKYLDAGTVYIRAAERYGNRDPLCAALFFEQAAFCYLKMRFPRFRKYTFTLTLAGDHFQKVGIPEHAIGCYLAASQVYKDRGWKRVDNHLNLNLAREFHQISLLPQACDFAKTLFTNTTQPPIQSSNFREMNFLFSLLSHQMKGTMIPILPVPKINIDSILVYFNSSYPINQRDGFASLGKERESEWGDLEDILKSDDVHSVIMDMRLSDFKKYSKKYLSSRPNLSSSVSVVTEYVHVDLEIINPLSIPIQLEGVQLVCTHQDSSSSSSPHKIVEEEEGVLQLIEEEENLDEKIPIADMNTVFTKAFDLFLRADSKRKVRLSLLPMKEGVVRIRGVAFFLANTVWARIPLSLPARRIVKTPDQSKGKFYEQDPTLTFDVTSSMPYLIIKFQNFPKYILQGEIRKLSILITNRGKTGLKNLRVAMIHPEMFVFGKVETQNQKETPFPPPHPSSLSSPSLSLPFSFSSPLSSPPPFYSEEAQMYSSDFDSFPSLSSSTTTTPSSSSSPSSSVVSSSPGSGLGLVHFPNLNLASGQSIEIPVFVRSTVIGQFQPHFLWYYEPEIPNKKMSHRVLRVQENLSVLPSIKLEKMVTWSSSGLDSYILSIEATNLQKDVNFELKQITAVSPHWTLSPLSYTERKRAEEEREEERRKEKEEGKEKDMFLISPKERTTLFFRVTPVEREEKREGEREEGEWEGIDLGGEKEKEKEKERERKMEEEEECPVGFGPVVKFSVSPLLTYLSLGGPVVDCEKAPFFTFAEKEKKELSQLTLSRTLPMGHFPHAEHKDLNHHENQRPLDVHIFWETAGRHFGQTSLLNLNLSPLSVDTMAIGERDRGSKEPFKRGNPLLALAQFEDCPLRFVLDIPSVIHHDFSQNRFCVVGATFKVENSSFSKPLSFTFETLKPSGNQESYVWSSKTFYTIRDLRPCHQVDLYTEVCFAEPGVYDINRFKFVVTPLSQMSRGSVFLYSPFQHLVTVRDTRA